MLTAVGALRTTGIWVQYRYTLFMNIGTLCLFFLIIESVSRRTVSWDGHNHIAQLELVQTVV